MGAVSTLSFSIASTAGYFLSAHHQVASAGSAATLASEVHGNGEVTATTWIEGQRGEVSGGSTERVRVANTQLLYETRE